MEWNAGPQAPWERGPVEPFLGGLSVHSFRFPNGLELKVVPDSAAPVVAYQTWFRVGAADEVTAKSGLAHLFEHLMFKGTDGYADGEYMARLDQMGAEGMNAWTWLDQTVYLQAVPKDRLDDVAALEATRMDGLVVDEQTFRSELEVVMNERRLVVDNRPEGRLAEQLFATAFGTHPYGAPTIGWMEDLERLTAEQAIEFYRRFYAPNNATILIVGDVTPEQAVETVARHYHGLSPARVRREPRQAEPPQTAQRRRELALPISTDRILIAFRIPEYTHPDMPALLVLDAAISAGQTGRLKRALRDTGLVTDVKVSIAPLRDPTLLEVELHGRAGLPSAVAEGRFWDELARLHAEGISEGELRMGIAQWEAYTLGQLEDALGKASFLGWSMTHTGDFRDGLRRIEAIRQVTIDDCNRVAREYLRPERATVVVGRPESPAQAISAPPSTRVPAAQRVIVRARSTDRSSALPPHQVVRRSISGARALLVNDPSLELVHFQLAFPRGSAADPAELPGLANLCARMVLRGTVDRPRREYEEALEQLGASIGVSVDADGVLVYGKSLRSSWPAFASLVAEAIARPAFDPTELDQLVLEVRNQLTAMLDDDGALAGLALSQALYGPGHPYGVDSRGRRASLDRVTPDDLRDFHSRYLRADGAVIGVAGGIDIDVERDLRELLAGVAGTPAVAGTWPPPPRRSRVILVDKPGRTQAQVRIGQLGIDQRREDFPAFVLANDAFGVGFGGRLFKEIRVKRGWSYFAGSGPQIRAREGGFVVAFAPGNDHSVDAVELALELCRDVDRHGFTAEELDRARDARVNGRPFLASTARKRLDIAMRAETVGYDRVAATDVMATVDLPTASAAFAGVLEPDRMVVVVTGTADALRDKLEAQLGPVDVVPWTAVAP